MRYACPVEDTERTRAEAEQAIAHVVAQLAAQMDDAYAAAATTVSSIRDPQQAFEVATRLAEEIRKLHDLQIVKLRRLRAQQAVRIREKESLSLAALAERISVSKQRADQLVRDAAGKAGRKE
jgi:hypothetical protein